MANHMFPERSNPAHSDNQVANECYNEVRGRKGSSGVPQGRLEGARMTKQHKNDDAM